VFIDLVDAVANNTVLECIHFNTPIITRRLPSLEEYLGKDYPLFFDQPEDLEQLQEEVFFMDAVIKAHQYLVRMDKSHIHVRSFCKKILYDMTKLTLPPSNTKEKLTWFTFINDPELSLKAVDRFLACFKAQTVFSQLKLVVFLDNLPGPIAEQFCESLLPYSSIYPNISVITFSPTSCIEYCATNCTTDLLTILKIQDMVEPKFSETFLDYFETHRNCDIAFSSYQLDHARPENVGNTIFPKHLLYVCKEEKHQLPITGVVWRKDLYELFRSSGGEVYDVGLYDFWKDCLAKNLNIMCVSGKPLYTVSL
jgi:hypothetical protein